MASQRFAAARLSDTQAAQIGFAKPPCFVVLDGRRDKQSSTAIRANTGIGRPLVGAIVA
jgi:hypothetical protein